MKTKTIATICAIASVLAGAVHAQTIQVSQGGILGQFDAYKVTGSSLAQLYEHHDWVYHGHENGLPAISANSITSFFVEADDGLGFFHIYSDPRSSGGTGEAITEILSSTNIVLDFLVKDDSTDDDTYAVNAPTSYTAHNYWSTGLTDGFVLGHLDGNWELDVSMVLTNTNITSWNVLGHDGQDWSTITNLLDYDQGATATFSAVPEPSTIAFFALAGLGAIATMRRRGAKQPKQ